MKLNNYIIDIEGIDKTGKNLLMKYINQLSNYKYITHPRGILSHMVYAEKFNRGYDYELSYRPIIIYLDADEEDRQIRCKITNEPYIDANADRLLFNKYIQILQKNGIIVLRYNTTEKTPYSIAKEVIDLIETEFYK